MGSVGDLVAGGLGGMANVLTGQPMDTLKVKLQTHPHLYRSLLHSIAKTYSEEGFRGFYAGASPAIVSYASEFAVLFLFYGQCQEAMRWVSGTSSKLSTFQKACAGSLATVIASVVSVPTDRIKCKLQVQRQVLEGARKSGSLQPTMYPSIQGVARQMVKEDGAAGLFRGLTTTWIRNIPGSFFYFGGNEASRKFLTPQGRDSEERCVWRMALAGGIAGCCFWIAMFPADVVRSRIYVHGDLSTSFWTVALSILRKEGVLTLYKGLLPTLCRTFPANAALWVTYEHSRKLFNQI